MDTASLNRIYSSYHRWKAWSGSPCISSEIYAKELRRAGVKKHHKILEIGFGDGGFLHWASQHGYTAIGADRTEACVTKAIENGFKVYLDDGSLDFLSPESIDAIIAFDVLEHMDIKALLAFLDNSKKVLKTDGIIFARVPNCASPYGMAYQFGDLTHLTALSELRFHQIAISANLTCENIYPAAVSTKGKNFIETILRSFVFSLRTLHGTIISYLYYGRKIIMAPAISAILRK